MTGLHTVFGLNGPLIDHSHRGQPSPALVSPDTPAATTAASRTRHVDRRVVDRLIDRLRAQTPPPLAGEPDAEFVRDLFRAPPFPEKPRERITQLDIASHPPISSPASASSGGALCEVRAITTTPITVSADLPTDGRR